MFEKIFGFVVVFFLIWLLIRILRYGVNMIRGMFGMETLEVAKANSFAEEKIKDGTILFEDYQKYVDLLYKAGKNKAQTMKRLEAEVKAGNLVPIKLPEDCKLPKDATRETVEARIDQIVQGFNMEHICQTAGKGLTTGDQEKYNALVYMTLHALTEIKTVEEAKQIVNDRIRKPLNEYRAEQLDISKMNS